MCSRACVSGRAPRFTCASSTARCEMRRTETVKTRVFFFPSAVSQLSDIWADGWETTWVDVGGAPHSDVGVGDHPFASTPSGSSDTRLALRKAVVCFSCLFPLSWKRLTSLSVCLFPPGFHPDVAQRPLTSVAAGRPSDVAAAALLSDWLEPRQPQPHPRMSSPP